MYEWINAYINGHICRWKHGVLPRSRTPVSTVGKHMFFVVIRECGPAADLRLQKLAKHVPFFLKVGNLAPQQASSGKSLQNESSQPLNLATQRASGGRGWSEILFSLKRR